MSNNERLDKIRKSLKVGDVVNGNVGYISPWYIIKDIKKLDTPIPDRQNIKLSIKLKPIKRDECITNKVYYIADILQFALIQYDS